MAETSKPSQPMARPVRKFAVEPVESSHKSNRGQQKQKEEENNVKPRRRFAPQLEETSTKHVGKAGKQTRDPEPVPAVSIAEPEASTQKPSTRKIKFAPQLIETTKRSRRRGDKMPALNHTDKTDLSPGDEVHLPRHMRLARPTLPVPPVNSPAGSSHEVPTESRFSSSNLAKKAPRRTSFRTPELAPINSSDESNGSKVPSLSTTPSASEDNAETYKHSSRIRESCDERFSGYLLALAARVAEKQLKEQVMAAYPNENMHEPVDHFAIDKDSGQSSEDEVHVSLMSPEKISFHQRTTRRESAAGWDADEMRRHKETLEKQRNTRKEAEAKVAAALPPGDGVAAMSNQSPFYNPFSAAALPKPDTRIGGPTQPNFELRKMRSAASPPMLGGDIVFPKSLSPKATHIDATQKPQSRLRLGNAQADYTSSRERSGLWTPVTGNSPIATRKNTASAGLWNGVCTGPANDQLCPPGPNGGRLFQSGLMTPRSDVEESFSRMLTTSPESERKLQQVANAQLAAAGGSACGGSNALSSPLPSPSSLHNSTSSDHIDEIMNREATIDREFPDEFVTQVYNYLSLGYPALARKFDYELSKISAIDVQEIRRDDGKRNAKGFVALPEEQGARDAKGKYGGGAAVLVCCARWSALRLYVREWGRQEGRMKGEAEVLERWGQTARKGSWAI